MRQAKLYFYYLIYDDEITVTMRWLLFLFRILQIKKLRDQLIGENFIKSKTAGLKIFNLKSVLFWPPKKLEYHNEKMTNSLIIRKG